MTAIEQSPPTIIWPSAPMFQTSALKPRPSPTPISTSGVARISVSRQPDFSNSASVTTVR